MDSEKRILPSISKTQNKKQKTDPESWKTKKGGTSKFVHLKPNLEKDVDNATFYIENGLRKVRPHIYTWSAFAKKRWLGRRITELMENEFHGVTAYNLADSFSYLNVQVNAKPVDGDYVIKNSDFIQHTIHRHEMPVLDAGITVIEENDDYLVVNKPSSIPIHPCGRFYFNTVIGILAKEKNKRGLKIVHRLDRLTSGVLIFAKTMDASKEFTQLLQSKELQKEYICRVRGEFPWAETTCDKPISNIDPKNSLNQVRENGKPCSTKFVRMSTHGSYSIVRAFPLTGRTHQIRVHLQYLGYPIENDPVYGRWEFEAARKLPEDEADELLKREMHARTRPYVKPREAVDPTDPDYDPKCPECQLEFEDPKEDELLIYLHANSYTSDRWKFTADLPEWAR